MPAPGDDAVFGDIVWPDYRNLGMTSFERFINADDPSTYAQTYRQLQGLLHDVPYVFNGDTLAYMASGDPVNPQPGDDLDMFPADRRMLAGSGPFDFRPGDSQYVFIKYAVGQGSDHLESITRLKAILNDTSKVPTGMEPGPGSTLPERFVLSQNYPNPFNPSTVIAYELPRRSTVTLTIYNILGQEVRTLVDREQPAGRHQVTWDGHNGSGGEVASGVYLYRLTAGDQVKSRKMVLVR